METLITVLAAVLAVVPPWVAFALTGLLVVAHYAQRSRDERETWEPTHVTVEVRS